MRHFLLLLRKRVPRIGEDAHSLRMNKQSTGSEGIGEDAFSLWMARTVYATKNPAEGANEHARNGAGRLLCVWKEST